MRLFTPQCPECGERACHIEETMLCQYEIGQFENVQHPDPASEEFDYTGQYEDYGDTAQPNIVEGTVAVKCHNGHEWRTIINTGHEQPLPTLSVEAKAIITLTDNKMSLRWSYHKKAWVASMLHVETGNECQYVCAGPEGAIAGAHKKATTPRKAKK